MSSSHDVEAATGRRGTRRHRVVIAGAGVAGLEALAAMHELAGDRVDVTLVSPSTSFSLRADTVTAPFGRAASPPHDIATIATDHDALLLRDGLAEVHRAECAITTRGGREVPYDALLVAVGGRPRTAFADALTFRGARDVDAMRKLVADVDAGRAQSVAFVVPPGATWTLPIYELALLTAERTEALGLDVALTVITPEGEPAASLGRPAAAALAAALADRRVVLRRRRLVQRVEDGRLLDIRGSTLGEAARIVSLPILDGPQTRGLPQDPHGFIPVDAHCAVRGVPRAFGAGDATTVPVKQGGIAAHQGEIAARAIAVAAGADVLPMPLRAALHAHAAAATGPAWFRAPLRGTGVEAVSTQPLWWPPTKVAMPYLGAYLERHHAEAVRP
jgi:sulfide:quinone oxidoreductase